jgi:carboxyl-terminal processing protease
MQSRSQQLSLVVPMGAAFFFGLAVVVLPARAQDAETYELMRVFVDTFQEIDRNYVSEVDRRELIEAAIRGMLAELDPYSNFIGPSEIDQFNESVEQEFGGVGIRVNFNRAERAIEVMTPIPGSPAYKAGIHAGDRLIEIDGQPVKDFRSIGKWTGPWKCSAANLARK